MTQAVSPLPDATPVLIVGGGLAGLLTAILLAPIPTVVVSHAPLGLEASTGWAQGGIAAAVGADDSPRDHAQDTMHAGAGLCDPLVVAWITQAAPSVIQRLDALGAGFDRGPDGGWQVGREAAHKHARIVHAGGDQTGKKVLAALCQQARKIPSIQWCEGELIEVLQHGGRVTGALIAQQGLYRPIAAHETVLATGGLGGLFLATTNPLGNQGGGLVAAARAGALLEDLEFIQFHPTALCVSGPIGAKPLPLISEAVRGEGAWLVDKNAQRFIDELAPRDVVARAVWAKMEQG